MFVVSAIIPLLSGMVLWLVIGLIIIVLLSLFIGVLIFKSRAERDILFVNAPKVANDKVEDILRRNLPVTPCGEQPKLTEQIDTTPEENTIKQAPAPAEQSQQTVEELIGSIDSEDARELVKERDSELVRRLEDWALEVVDTMDELSRMPQEKGMAAYIERLRCQLTALDCTLIDSDKWDPDLQRAVKVEEATTPGSAPCITRKISTGLRVREKLVRKQSVIIDK